MSHTPNWFTPRAGQFASQSADGYYRVGLALPDGRFPAFHVESLWAIPREIGRAGSVTEAQTICDTHRTAPASAA